jgi:hypothetical protein
MWLNIYGEADPCVVEAVRERLSPVRLLAVADNPPTVQQAAKLLCRLGERDEAVAARVMVLHGREADPWKRYLLAGYLQCLGGRDMLPYLVDEVLANDPELLVRWRAALVVSSLLHRKTPEEAVRLLLGLVGDREGQALLHSRFPKLANQGVWMPTVRAVSRLSPAFAVPVLLAVLRQTVTPEGRSRDVVKGLLHLTRPWRNRVDPLTSMQREVLRGISELPANAFLWAGCFRCPLLSARLPCSREGLRDLLARDQMDSSDSPAP